MIHRNVLVGLALSLLFGFSGLGAAAPLLMPEVDGPITQEEFADPPLVARPRVYWDWMNGAVELEQLTLDLEEMKAKGMGGGEMWDTAALRNPDRFVPDGPAFLGEESLVAIHHCLREAKRLGLELGLVASSGWNSGGTWVTPEYAGKNIYHSTVAVAGPGTVSIDLPYPAVPKNCPVDAEGRPLYSREVVVLAVPASDSRRIERLERVLDLSDALAEGHLKWDAPAGEWVVLRFVLTNNGQQLIAGSPNSQGPFIDFLDPAATRMQFGYILDKLGMSPKEMRDSSLTSMEVDSMELEEGIQWSEVFSAYFKKTRRYAAEPWLPALVGWTIEDKTVTKRFLYDYHQAISDLLIESHYRTASDILAEYGLELVAEAGGPGPPIWNTCPVDALKALGAVGVPRGEFWIRHRNMFLIKQIASAANLYGKKLVDAESFTTWRRWMDSPYTIKPIGDRAFAEGLNRVTFHGFGHSPLSAGFPGRTYHAGYDINPRVTWWPMAKPFLDYLARCSYVLQKGSFVGDVLYYYGDQAPNFFPAFHDVPEKPGLPGLSKGYDFDVLNTEVLLDRLTVEDGKLQLPGGLSYEVLLLPESETMPLPVLERIASLLEQGATVLGSPPTTVPGWLDYKAKQEELRTLVEKVWGTVPLSTSGKQSRGKGTLHWGATPDRVLEELGVERDFLPDSEGEGKLDYIHRRLADQDTYFVHNRTFEAVDSLCSFRVEGKSPEFWNPVSGEVEPAWEFTPRGNRTEVRMTLPPAGSVFIVFSPDDSRKPISLTGPARVVRSDEETAVLEVRDSGEVALTSALGGKTTLAVESLPPAHTLAGPWTVAFPEGWGAPSEAIFDSLESWTDSENEGIRFFSGTATYRNTFEVTPEMLEEGLGWSLDLGDVRDMARVAVNGSTPEILWTAPFRVDLKDKIRAGKNTLEIEVVNQWINRLTGDLERPPEERFTRTNQTPWTKDIGGDEIWKIQPAGLIGPVRLVPSRRVTLHRE